MGKSFRKDSHGDNEFGRRGNRGSNKPKKRFEVRNDRRANDARNFRSFQNDMIVDDDNDFDSSPYEFPMAAE